MDLSRSNEKEAQRQNPQKAIENKAPVQHVKKGTVYGERREGEVRVGEGAKRHPPGGGGHSSCRPFASGGALVFVAVVSCALAAHASTWVFQVWKFCSH